MAKLNLVKALNLALLQEMERDEDVLIMGEDVGVDGGVFRVTEDLHRKFGSKRVIDSPLAEAAIVGAGVGMALYGLKPVCEIQFSGFAFQCFHQIENHVARDRTRTMGRFHVPMVIRMPFGGGVRRCVGAAFAQFEARTVLDEIVHARELRPAGRPIRRVSRRGIVIVPPRAGRIVSRERPDVGTRR